MTLHSNLRGLFAMSALISILLTACRSNIDLVLDDPVFLEDMVNAALAGELFKVTPEDYPGIRRLLAHSNPDHRRAGVILAAQADDKRLFLDIIDAAMDDNAPVSEESVAVIRERVEEFRPLLLDMLENNEPSRRSLGLLLLGEVGDEDLVPILIRLFPDPDPDVRNRASLAVHALARRRNSFLQDALTDRDPMTVAIAYRTLGRYGDPDDAPRFIAAFTHPHSDIRKEVQLAALRLGETGLPILHIEAGDSERPYESRLASLNVIQGLRSPESLGVLIMLLEDSDQRIRTKASGILGTYGSEAAPALIRLYVESGEAERIHAVRLMGEIRAAGTLPTLAGALDDPSAPVREAARLSMESFGAEARQTLRNIILEESGISANIALEMLRDTGDPWLVRGDDDTTNPAALFLLITESDAGELGDYLIATEVTRLKNESILSLKEAWDRAEHFVALENEIVTGSDPYLYVWRRRELYAVAARENLRESFEALHGFFDTGSQKDLDRARKIRAESRRLETEAQKQRDLIAAMSPETRARGRERLERYRELRDSLVRSWEYVDSELRPIAEAVFADRGLDPRALSRESTLLE